MPPLGGLGAIVNPVTAIASAASLGGDYLQYRGARDINSANIALSQRQMDFQERMSSTSYQRAVKDLEAAGLNPMLALMHGGASTPAGSAAKLENPMAHMSGAAGRVVSSAAGVAQVENIVADTNLKDATAQQARANTLLVQEQVPKLRQEIANLKTQNDVERFKAQLLSMDIDKLKLVIPELIKQEQAKTALWEFGRTSIKQLTEQEKVLWPWLRELGGALGRTGAELEFSDGLIDILRKFNQESKR